MADETCSRCGRVIWRYEEYCSGCGIAASSADELSALFHEVGNAPKQDCARCGRECRCVSVLFLYREPRSNPSVSEPGAEVL